MCFSLRAYILKLDSVTYAPDIKSICFANDHDFPLERVPRRAPPKVSHELACHCAYAQPLVFSSSANTVLFCPAGRADKISSDTIIWSEFNKKLEFSLSQTQRERGSGQIQKAVSRVRCSCRELQLKHNTAFSMESCFGFPTHSEKRPSKRDPVGFLLESSRGIIGSDKNTNLQVFHHFHRPWFQKYFPIRFLYRLFVKSCTNRSITLQALI